MSSTGSPVMLPPEGGRLIAGGAVHARLLVAHDHPSYASTFEMTVAPGFDVGAHVHGNGEEMFYVIAGELDVLCFEPADRSLPDWHAWTSPSGQKFLHGLPGSFLYDAVLLGRARDVDERDDRRGCCSQPTEPRRGEKLTQQQRKGVVGHERIMPSPTRNVARLLRLSVSRPAQDAVPC